MYKLIQRDKRYVEEFGTLPDSYYFIISIGIGNKEVRTLVRILE